MFEIVGLPAFDDNYIWLLVDETHAVCTVVDPGDEDPVIEYMDARGLSLLAILITHKHWDHTGGIADLKFRWPDAVVYGPANEDIAGVEEKLTGGMHLSEPALEVLDVPGHTEGHIAYLGEGYLFCGDTLFAGGCGRVFSGTHEQFSDSLRLIADLPVSTQICCAHEYTTANLGFARWVEPENMPLLLRIEAEKSKRRQGLPTVPSSLELELATNPFMRTGEPGVISAAENRAGHTLSSHREVFKALRQWKDQDYD
jgi:hydroxyacylglutathione hydrolase